MLGIKDIKYDLIDLIMRINDFSKLRSLYEYVENDVILERGNRISLEDATVELKEGVTLDEIIAEQDITQITYLEIRKIADSMEWEHSLEELLEGLD